MNSEVLQTNYSLCVCHGSVEEGVDTSRKFLLSLEESHNQLNEINVVVLAGVNQIV